MSQRAQAVVVITNLISFNGTNGSYPSAPLLQARDGSLYGTTLQGGLFNNGTIFQISSNYQLNTRASLNFTNGSEPISGVIQGNDGNFYGTALFGGNTNLEANGYGFGTIFQLTTNGILNVLASFSGTNGSSPNGLVQSSNGTFYGTTRYGAQNQVINTYNNGDGTLFALDTNHNITNPAFFTGANGNYSVNSLVFGTNGALYGTTEAGGSASVGNAFELTSNLAFSSLLSFGGSNGYTPNNLVLGLDGNFYGTTQGSTTQFGTVFRMAPDGTPTTIANFTTNTGFTPTFLMQAKDGNLLGTTSAGGAYDKGTVFELSTNNALTVLYSFTGGADGNDATSLMQATDGNFYGVTSYGGDFLKGSIFKLSLVPSPDIQNIGVTGGSVTFTWPAAVGQNYQVQYNTNLTQTNWSVLTNFNATAVVGSATDSAATGQRFYRVVLVL